MKKESTVLEILKKSIPLPKLIVGIIFSVIGSFLTLMVPQIIGVLSSSDAIKYLSENPQIIIYIILFIIGLYTIKTLSNYFLGSVGAQSIENVQDKFSSHVLNLPISVLDKFQAADISSRLTNDIVVISKLSAVIIPDIIINSVIVSGSFIFLFSINFKLTLYVLLIVPIFILVNLPINKKLEKIYKKQQTLLGKISGNFTQSINNIKLIKSFNAEEDESSKHNSYFKNLSDNMKKMVLIGASLSSISEALIIFHLTFLIIYLSFTYYNGGVDVSELIVFFMYVIQVISPILELLSDATEIFEGRGAISRLTEILEIETEDCNGNKENRILDSSIKFNNVSFGYDDRMVLNDISFDIKKDEFVSIVGPSGAGKSTILSLIYKYYRGYSGDIKIGDISLDEISVFDLRNNISFILQNNLVFSDTIRNNLIYGKNKKVNEEKILDIARITTIDQFINKYDGLDTVIGEEGVLLSEGQKQKINIARNLLSNPKILLLDEPSSSLDAESENILNEILDTYRGKMTIVVVAHRLTTILNSDKIIVLNDDGEVEAIGDHSLLMKISKTYNKFYQMSMIDANRDKNLSVI